MRFLHFVYLFFFLSASAYSQEKSLPAEIVTSIMQRIDAGTNPSIVVGMIDADGPGYFSFGNTKEGGKPVNEHSIYEIGSISKVFTACLLADFVTKGQMNVDDPVEKYLPGSVHVPVYEGKHISLGNLSDHTSSLPRLPNNMTPADPLNPYADYTVSQMYDFLGAYQLDRPIGSSYEYSNLAVGLLGHILALRSGTSYEKLMIQTIAKPLQMKETRIRLTGKMKKNLAPGHNLGSPVPNWDLPALAGAGAIRSSVYDMLKFLSAQMNMTATPLHEAMELTQQARHDKANGMSVGLGWHIAAGGEYPVIWHNGGTGGYRTFAGFIKETGKGVVVFTNSSESVDDIGFHLLDATNELRDVRPNIAGKLKDIIEKEGPQQLSEKYRKLKETHTEQYDFTENEINAMGYYYLSLNQIDAALALFEINVMEYPASSNVYDSYGEALMKKGEEKAAIENYRKSLELNPGNTNAVDMLAKMGVQVSMDEVTVAENILESYVGTYELFPGFDIVITHEGKQLFGQVTGQDKFEIFAKSNSEFYYKVVDAQIRFNENAQGTVESLTLHQNGKDVIGKKKA